jgi:hypothetical protein
LVVREAGGRAENLMGGVYLWDYLQEESFQEQNTGTT